MAWKIPRRLRGIFFFIFLNFFYIFTEVTAIFAVFFGNLEIYCEWTNKARFMKFCIWTLIMIFYRFKVKFYLKKIIWTGNSQWGTLRSINSKLFTLENWFLVYETYLWCSFIYDKTLMITSFSLELYPFICIYCPKFISKDALLVN